MILIIKAIFKLMRIWNIILKLSIKL
jgi:hypothetical protein